MFLRKKFRIIVFSIVTFVMFVSYKILEPDILKQNIVEGIYMEDLDKVTQSIKEDYSVGPGNTDQNLTLREAVIEEITRKYLLDYNYELHESPWIVAANLVRDRYIHPVKSPELGGILKAIATEKILSADTARGGTQLKLLLFLEGGQRVIFKPRWYTRDHVITDSPYAGWDRHNGEIAAFHIGRLFEFNRTPLVVGRKVNLRTEIMSVASTRLLDTFYTSETGNNLCFYGRCYYCKGKDTGVCGDGEMMEGVIVLWLPTKYKLRQFKHPWARTYNDKKRAKWEDNDAYCRSVIQSELYKQGPRLLDVIDTAVLDYIIGNADRHHYETLGNKSDSIMLILDNAKSFGNPNIDVPSILAPLDQCCRLRFRTWERLLVLQDGVLSSVLKSVLDQDPISPVLTEPHYDAITRRVEHILAHVHTCIAKHGLEKVFVND